MPSALMEQVPIANNGPRTGSAGDHRGPAPGGRRDAVGTDGGVRDKGRANGAKAEHGFVTVPKVIE